ncbi:hypothetical protein Syun_029780 [Stephania yunnanensis]|uniref:Uncharacterized protein n=1 Tax=Stephania yunnanensis TaxID=152371 RepID=A0AAP0E694_9MAGN
MASRLSRPYFDRKSVKFSTLDKMYCRRLKRYFIYHAILMLYLVIIYCMKQGSEAKEDRKGKLKLEVVLGFRGWRSYESSVRGFYVDSFVDREDHCAAQLIIDTLSQMKAQGAMLACLVVQTDLAVQEGQATSTAHLKVELKVVPKVIPMDSYKVKEDRKGQRQL